MLQLYSLSVANATENKRRRHTAVRRVFKV